MTPQTRKIVWALALLAGLSHTSGCGDELRSRARAENVILISLDTLRADRLGAYGYDRPTSPNMDALARDGVLYTNVASVSPWTVPSHASLLTGIYPSEHGVLNYEHRLPDGVTTLAGTLGEHGFETLGIISSTVLIGGIGGDAFDRFLYVSEWQGSKERRSIRNPGEEITDLALKWLAEPREGPFFVFLHYYDIHSDYTPKDEYRELFVEDYDGEYDGTTAQLLRVRAGLQTLDSADIEFLSQLYDAEIRQVDDQIGRLLAYLEESGLAETTSVVITSDHGEELMEHGAILHGVAYYEESIAVPLIIRGPGVPAGLRVEDLTSLIDIAPTILALLGIDAPARMQGVDLRDDWRPEGRNIEPRFVYAEADWQNEVSGLYRMVRDQRYKLIYNRVDGTTQLFDLSEDPLEQNESSDRKPEIAARLTQSVLEHMASASGPTELREVSPEELERLRGLGYAD